MNRHDMSQSSQTLDSTLSKEISIISVTQMTKLIDYIFNILLIIDTSGRFLIRPWPHGQQRTFHWRGQYMNLDSQDKSLTYVKLKHHK